MSGELIVGLWFLLCAFVGVWRLSRTHEYRAGFAWKLEFVLTLFAFAVAIVLLALVIAARVMPKLGWPGGR